MYMDRLCFQRSMVICGVDMEDEATSALEALLEVSEICIYIYRWIDR